MANLFAFSTRTLILALFSTLIAVSDCSESASSNPTSHNATDRDGRKGTRLDRIFSRLQGLETKEVWYNLPSLFGTERDVDVDRISDEREGHEKKKSRRDLKILDVRGGKRTKRSLYQPEGHEAMKERYNVTDIHSIMSYRRLKKYAVYNWSDADGDVRQYISLKRISDQQARLETKRNWYNRTSGDDTERGEIILMSNGRQEREAMNAEYEPPIPDGFQHYYVPFSTIPNHVILAIVQPQHMLWMRQSHNVSECLKYRLIRLDILTLDECFDDLTSEILTPKWLIHLIGFIIVCCILLLVAFFMMILCPCLMCWQTSCKPVVQAGKLDTYSDASWAMITLFCCLTMLFALFGVISVGCGGIGMGYYLFSGKITLVYSTYDEVQAIALEAQNEERQAYLQDTNKIKVHGLHVTMSTLSLRICPALFPTCLLW